MPLERRWPKELPVLLGQLVLLLERSSPVLLLERSSPVLLLERSSPVLLLERSWLVLLAQEARRWSFRQFLH
jgi:hypothetical protein